LIRSPATTQGTALLAVYHGVTSAAGERPSALVSATFRR
jgi:hypothetical protein